MNKKKENPMNSRLDAIFARRSIRSYKDMPVGDEAVKDILEAAMAAPSAVAKDPWDFIVVRDKTLLAKIADILPNGKMIAHAPLGIIVCGDIGRAHGGELSYMLQDCSAAVENMLLAVSMLGLGACWLGVHPRPERISRLKTMFSLPENIIPVAAVAIGHPAEKIEARTRYDEKKIHHGKW